MSLKFYFVIILLEFSTRVISFDYENYKVYDIIPSNPDQTDLLHEFSESDIKYDFWDLTRIPGKTARVMVSPEYQNEFENLLTSSNINFSISIEDVSRSIKLERINNNFRRSLSRGVDFESYHRFDDINDYISGLAKKYPKIAITETVGKSYEGRYIRFTLVTKNIDERKNLIFIDAGIHAREWIAPAAALYVLHQLVENFEENEYLLDNFDWAILPVVNPDGYEYTHTGERLWRKTRKPNYNCSGTDGNRNFDFHWNAVGGSSTDECSELFRGVQPFSEPETENVQHILHAAKDYYKPAMYLTLHSFGNLLLYPWGFTSALPSTWTDIDAVAQAGARAIFKASGTNYTVGSSTKVLYSTAGGSHDYAFGVTKFPVSIAMELSGGKSSSFHPDPSEIKSIVEETWIGIKAMAEEIERRYKLKN